MLLVPLLALLSVRLFVLMHDCSHHALFKNKRLNDLVGFWLGVLVLTPHREWRRSHAIHHATAANLQRRNWGDLYVLTVAEYDQLPRRERVAYYLRRNVLVMCGLGPWVVFLFRQRFHGSLCEQKPHGRRSLNVHLTSLTAVTLFLLAGWGLGWAFMLVIWGLSFWLAAAVGIWLFYVQHNFEEVYYAHNQRDYSFEKAALEGASFLRLPRWLHWFTGNIGYHHVHHLDPRIPNYHLPACHERLFASHSVPTLTLWTGLRALRLKLYDTDTEQMVGWREYSGMVKRRTAGNVTFR